MIEARPTPPSTSSSDDAGEEAAALAGARAAIYRLLAASFLFPPDDATVAALSRPELRAFLGEALADPRLAAALGDLARAPASSAELSDEFHALFVVPGPRYCTPYESVFAETTARPDGTARPGLLWGEATRAVAAEYRAVGRNPAADLHELPDHIGVELLHVAWLCEAEQEALTRAATAEADACRRRQTGFLRDHLAPFAPALAARAEAAARLPWARAVAALLRAYVVAETEKPSAEGA